MAAWRPFLQLLLLLPKDMLGLNFPCKETLKRTSRPSPTGLHSSFRNEARPVVSASAICV